MRESEFDIFVSKKFKVQDINFNQLKLEVLDSYKKDEKITTNFKASNPDYAINKAYLEQNLSKIDAHISLSEKEYNDFKLLSNKQAIEEVLIQRSVKTTIQLMYDKGVLIVIPMQMRI